MTNNPKKSIKEIRKEIRRKVRQEGEQADLEEQEHQIQLFKWAALRTPQIPELDLLYHIPNEGKRSKIVGGILKAMGLKPGMPDVHLPVARGGYSSLYIEMKSKNGKLSARQKNRIKALLHAGNQCSICHSWWEAKDDILSYLKMEKTPSFEIRVEREPIKGWKVEQYGSYIVLPGASKQDLTEPKKAALGQALAVADELVKKNIEYVVKKDTVGWKMPFLVKKEEKKEK